MLPQHHIDDTAEPGAAEPGTGKLAFAQTYEEHARNVETYRPLWEAYDREQGN